MVDFSKPELRTHFAALQHLQGALHQRHGQMQIERRRTPLTAASCRGAARCGGRVARLRRRRPLLLRLLLRLLMLRA